MSRLLPIRLGRPPGSSFTPASITGLKLWLAADRITGLVDGDPVGTWSDLSGQGNHLTQATGSKKPTYKVGIQNGLPVARFDGVDDVLKATSFTLTQPHTVFAVLKIRAAALNAYLWDGNTTDASSAYQSVAGSLRMYAGSNGPIQALGTTNFHVLCAIYNNASSQLYLDGGTPATGTTGTNNPAGFTLGARGSGSGFSTIDVAEVAVYSGALVSSDAARLASYASSKYGITIT